MKSSSYNVLGNKNEAMYFFHFSPLIISIEMMVAKRGDDKNKN